ncbi:TonB-dependent receptor [Methylovulum psychrotolerans]|uniref:TonB-dependent receptor plug domain-containing protein n=1 Tax=Methylovulum psychrotolerans TaxID=1704499 RepID=UPI001BFFB28E|nr:TonB-dependent receptor [Methylovulum psychrotolerans]MBT9096240.1 TonB-dependent receptor [Methylovulum psychrotolerans]
MNIKAITSASFLLFAFCTSPNKVCAKAEVDDYFALSPAELANIPVSIATGTPKPIFQSAAITSVITADQIKAMGATELHEVMETVPGVHATLKPGDYDYSYSIRGISNSNNSEVLILLNGTRITTPFGGSLMTTTELPLAAIQRVEVIRGPGSALYGADAFAGVINIITKKADDINGTKVGVRAGNWDSQNAWAQHGGEWGGWKVATSLQYQHSQGDNGRIIHQDVQTTLDNAFGTHASLAPGALSTHNETLNAHLNLERKHWDIGFWTFNSINDGVRGGNASALDPNGLANGEQYLGDVRYSTEDEFSDWEFIAHTSYLHSDFLAQLQLFPNNARLPIGADGNINTMDPVALINFPNGVNANVGRVENIPSLEFTSIYRGLDSHILRANTAYRYEQFSATESKNFGPGVITNTAQTAIDGQLTNLTGTSYVYLADTSRSVGSLVAQDEWQIARDWQLTSGVRYDNYSDFGSTINPRVALVWDMTEQMTSKLLYGRAFRAPNFSELGTQNNPFVLGNRNLKPETINTTELSFDYRPWSALRTTVNLYYYEINNLILAVAKSDASTPQYQNIGNQKGYGSEFEWDWQLSQQWQLKGNYAWQHAINEATNLRVTGVPEHHVYAALGWRFSPQWHLQPQINWIGGRTSAIGDFRPLNDYETVDLTLRGKKLLKHLNFSASLRNAFGVHPLEPAVSSFPQNLPLAGRSFYFEASIDF